MKPETVLLILFVAIFLGFLYASQTKALEGFDGDVPETNQTSAIAQDTSSATTTNPQVALAQPKDIQALMETIKNFKLLFNAQNPMTLNLDPTEQQQVQYFSMQSDNLTNQLQTALANPDRVTLSFDDTVQLRKAYDCSIQILRGKSQNVVSTGLGTSPTGLTLDILTNLQTRVQAESLRLSNLRSSAATMTARIAQLDKLASNLGDIISSIQRGETQLADVNITPADANNFLSTLGTDTNTPVPVVEVPAPSGGAAKTGQAGFPFPNDIQSLVNAARDMKWSVSIALESDPAMRQSQSILDKISSIEASINKYMVSGTPMPPHVQAFYDQELAILKNLTDNNATATPDITRIVTGPPKPILQSRDSVADVFVPSQHDLDAAQGGTMGPAAGSASNGIGQGDYPMTDDQIQHRASAASFDDSMVGGLDYKTRALEMCRQIGAAGLGDPANFGCIKNPDEVSASYSWKGNYEMVCSRLGDTWGNWYPQMFGCPKVDPTAKFIRQS